MNDKRQSHIIKCKKLLKNTTSTDKKNPGFNGDNPSIHITEHSEKDSDTVPPVVMAFTTSDMVEQVLNSARGEGMGRFFKEHIPELSADQYRIKKNISPLSRSTTHR